MLFWIRIHSSCKRLFITKLKPMNKVRLHEVIFMNLQWCVYELENNFISKMWESYSWSDCSSISLSVKIIFCFSIESFNFDSHFIKSSKAPCYYCLHLFFLRKRKLVDTVNVEIYTKMKLILCIYMFWFFKNRDEDS